MAYFIDEVGKRGLKAEGKQFFVWDFDARKFSSPVDDAPPKSRMRRCSEFEAKRFNFASNNPGWEDAYDRLNEEIMDYPKPWEAEVIPSVDDVRREVRDNERFIETFEGRIAALLEPLVAYGVDGAGFADGIHRLRKILIVSRELAKTRLELAESIQEATQAKAVPRVCADCEFARTGQGRRLCEECANKAK